MTKLNYSQISKSFMTTVKSYKYGFSLSEMQAFTNGMTDVLDAIAEAHPELLFSMHSLRSVLEEALDIYDDEKDGKNA